MSPLANLVVTPEAEDDIDESLEWYGERSASTADEFMEAVERTITEIRRAPRRHRCYYRYMRRMLVTGFPYAVFYVAGEGEVSILAVMHQHRDPQDCQDRLR